MKKLYQVVSIYKNDEDELYLGYDIQQAILVKEQHLKYLDHIEIREYVLSREYNLDKNNDDYDLFEEEFIAGGVKCGYEIISETPSSRLKELRLAIGLSQSQLAVASGVNVRLIQDYEQNRKNIFGAAAMSIFKLAQALDTTVEYLLIGD